MFTIEELRDIRDKHTTDPERDLFSKLVYSHLDANHVIEQRHAEIKGLWGTINTLRRQLRAVVETAQLGLDGTEEK